MERNGNFTGKGPEAKGKMALWGKRKSFDESWQVGRGGNRESVWIFRELEA